MSLISTACSITSYYHPLFTVLALFISALIFIFSRKSKSKSIVHLPPGPPGWPLVGNLFQFARSGKPFFVYVDDMRSKYGSMFTLRMGASTMIIVSDATLAHEALIERGALFASRPSENPTRTIFSCNKFTVNAADYGPVWRSLRRNMVQNMLSTSRIKEFKKVRDKAMDTLIDRIRADGETNRGAVWVIRNTRFAVFCILLAMCFGLEMDEETITRMDEIMKKVLIVLNPRLDDYLPMLSPFFSKQRKRVTEVRKEQVDFMVTLIERRRRALQSPASDSQSISFSYLDTLFNLEVEGRTSPPTNQELVTLCSEFLNGGTDTTATGIEWAIAELIENPEVQTKLFDEIQRTAGDRKVEEKDVENMEYLQAVIKELLRKHPPTYFLLPHTVAQPTTLGGFDIPLGMKVEFFLPAIAGDTKIWSEPEKFNPDRFMGSNKEVADITGVTGVKMMPFGAGRRICPGLGLGTIHLHLMLARMVQEFEWSACPPGSKVDFTGKLEFTVSMKNPLRAMIKSRV